MKSLTKILFTYLLLISACQKDISEKFVPASGGIIHKTVKRALEGIKTAQDSLSILIDSSRTDLNSYNKIKVDSLIASGKFFSILIEYPKSIHNRFAIYNDSLKCMLVDKSLNGILSEKVVALNDLDFFSVDEAFHVRDNLILNRLSLYQVKNSKPYLVFRIFTRLKMPGEEYTQIVKQISDKEISTQINSTEKGLAAEGDVFNFDSSSNSYNSKENFFNNFVLGIIQSSPAE